MNVYTNRFTYFVFGDRNIEEFKLKIWLLFHCFAVLFSDNHDGVSIRICVFAFYSPNLDKSLIFCMWMPAEREAYVVFGLSLRPHHRFTPPPPKFNLIYFYGNLRNGSGFGLDSVRPLKKSLILHGQHWIFHIITLY